MPQFDPTSFASQLFWLAVTFIALYFLLSRLVLPRISEVMEKRSERIANDLERAEALKTETEAVIEAYEAALAKARNEASAVIAKATSDIAALSATRQAEFGEELAMRMVAAEERISKAKQQAESQIREIAVDIAADVAERLTGRAIDAESAAQAVDTQMKGNG
ncbi:MAG: F0F1 ATP synthase subunit B' [Pseudomonadota bacterium]